jgi:hypothetical protein
MAFTPFFCTKSLPYINSNKMSLRKAVKDEKALQKINRHICNATDCVPSVLGTLRFDHIHKFLSQ